METVPTSSAASGPSSSGAPRAAVLPMTTPDRAALYGGEHAAAGIASLPLVSADRRRQFDEILGEAAARCGLPALEMPGGGR